MKNFHASFETWLDLYLNFKSPNLVTPNTFVIPFITVLKEFNILREGNSSWIFSEDNYVEI